MKKIKRLLNYFFFLLNRAWQGLKLLSDPALEGNPYASIDHERFHKSEGSFVLHKPSFLSRRRGFI